MGDEEEAPEILPNDVQPIGEVYIEFILFISLTNKTNSPCYVHSTWQKHQMHKEKMKK